MSILVAGALLFAASWLLFKVSVWCSEADGWALLRAIACSVPVLAVCVGLIYIATVSVLGLSYQDL